MKAFLTIISATIAFSQLPALAEDAPKAQEKNMPQYRLQGYPDAARHFMQIKMMSPHIHRVLERNKLKIRNDKDDVASVEQLKTHLREATLDVQDAAAQIERMTFPRNIFKPVVIPVGDFSDSSLS